jgi:hypothetical protein
MASKNVRKVARIRFANKSVDISKHLLDIRNALENASFNLYYSRHVHLQWSRCVVRNNSVLVPLDIPEEEVERFSVGRSLRGVPYFLLHECEHDYKQYLVGTRLMEYELWDLA